MKIHPDEMPVSLQLFGSEPDTISEVAKRLEELPFSILDINMGCPVPKIVKNGEGSALMIQPKLVEEIVTKTVKAIRKPVTVKIRKGFDDEHINAVEIAKIVEASGGAAVAVHGRTREQYYSGQADWDIIRKVKEAVSIPVIGNGDVTSPLKAEEMRRQTGCDGVMVGRGVQGNPWIFRELVQYERTGLIPERPAAGEITENASACKDADGRERRSSRNSGDEKTCCVVYDRSSMQPVSGIEINQAESYEELEKLLTGGYND